MHNLKRRGITAIFFVLTMVGGVLAGKLAFLVLFGLVLLFCLWEFFTLVFQPQPGGRLTAMLPGLLPFIMAANLYFNPYQDFGLSPLYTILGLGALFFLIIILELVKQTDLSIQRLSLIALGTLYIGIPFSLLFLIAFAGGDYRSDLLLGLLFLTWINDTGAYFVGSLIGKRPLMRKISPKKTLEGTVGGFVFSLLLCLVLEQIFPALHLTEWMGLALIGSIFGVLGDLSESMLKRNLKVKDSGDILPGHGGFLDRFDAFIFIIPFAAFYITLFNL